MDSKEFEKKMKSGKTILIDFYATWCGPCQMMAPILEELKDSLKDNKNVEVMAVDIDQNPEIPAKYNIMSVPTFLIVKNNNVLETIIGATTKENLLEKIEKNSRDK